VTRGWTSRKPEEHWQSICGQRQATGFLKRPSAKRSGALLDLSRNQLRIITRLLRGHCHLKGHFKIPGVTDTNRHLKQPHMWLQGIVGIKIYAPGPSFLETGWLPTSPSARYCTLCKLRGWWMLGQSVAQKIWIVQEARVTEVPTLMYSTLFSMIRFSGCYNKHEEKMKYTSQASLHTVGRLVHKIASKFHECLCFWQKDDHRKSID
jgi:hypothetical protein